MNVKRLRRIGYWSFLVLATGCATTPTTQVRQHTLAELYKQAEQVNATADPYAMGVGDGIGARSYGNFLREVRVTPPPSAAPE